MMLADEGIWPASLTAEHHLGIQTTSKSSPTSPYHPFTNITKHLLCVAAAHVKLSSNMEEMLAFTE